MRDFRQGRYTPKQVSNSLVPQNSVSGCENVNFDTVVGQAVVRPGTTQFGATVSAGQEPLGLAEFVGFSGNPNLLLAVFSGPGVLTGTGTITDDGFGNITGVGTAFMSQLQVGWQIQVPGESTTATIVSIADDTDMVVSTNTMASGEAFTYTETASIYYYDTSWHQSTKTNITNGTKNRFSNLGGWSFITNNVDGMFDSTDGNTWGQTNTITTGTYPSIIYRYNSRLVANGSVPLTDRLFFSSVVDPTSSPIITWNTDPALGDYIDINPDDGGYLTGFSETSTFLLVFKNTGMYRLDTLTKTTDAQNIYNVGAPSQEAITLCQGITYYFSGQDIRRTNGGFPDQISRAGVQDIIDAIPQSNWLEVYAWNDGLNVYFSIGDVTLNRDQDRQFSIKNCVLKFSPRDQNWSVHGYADHFKYGSQYTTSDGRFIRSTDIVGRVQSINLGTTDNGTEIPFYLETQDLEFGSRSRLKGISDKLIVFMNNGIDSSIQFRLNGENIKDVKMSTNQRVNIGKDLNMQGNFFNLRWSGTSSGTPPAIEGFQIEDITDLGTNTINNG